MSYSPVLCSITIVCFCASPAVPVAGLELTTVTPERSDAVLFNPGMGLYLSGGTRTRVQDDDWFKNVVNIMYIRDNWSRVEPVEDNPFGKYFDPLFDYWVKQRGMRLAFRFMSENVSTREPYVTPRWVFDKGVPSVQHTNRFGVQTDPIFWDERYLRECERFIEKLGAYLDGREGFEFIDIGSIGEWGEMHLGLHIPGRWTPDQLEETGFTETKYIGAHRRVIDAHARAFPRSQVFLNVGRYGSINDYAAIQGIHFRQDGLTPRGPSSNVGKLFYVPYSRRGTKGNYEFHSSYDGMKKKGWDFKATVEKGLEDPISYLNTNCFWMPRLRKAPEEARAILTDAARRVGYRFVVTKVTVPVRLHADREHAVRMPITTEWKNEGVAPCTESFAVEFLLADSRGRIAGRQLSYPPTPTTRWWPGETVVLHNLLRFPAAIKPGKYTLKVAMLWPEKDRRIFLGIKGRDAQDSYDLCSLDCVRVPPRQTEVLRTGFEGDEPLWSATEGITVERDTAVKHSGKASMRVEGRQQGAWSFAAISAGRPILPGARYRLSCWMRVDVLDPRNRAPFVKIGLDNAEGKWITNRSTIRYNTREMGTWQRLSVAFDTTAVTAGGILAIEKGVLELGIEVKLWLDDVTLELLEAP